MNSKKAKALRRLAREYSGQAPDRSQVTLRNGQAINVPYSERGLYRRLKLGERHQLPRGKDI